MLRNFDYEQLRYEDRTQIHNALAETTVKHITASEGLFRPMPFDPAASPSQLLETVHLPPVPTTFDEVNGIATVAGPNFYPFICDRLQKQRAFFSAARLLMSKGENITAVTPHGTIADVGYWQAGWVNEIEQEDWQERNGLIISRGVTTIEAFGMAASEVVQKAGHVFLSFPRTKTVTDLAQRFNDSHSSSAHSRPAININRLIDTNNHRMRDEVQHFLGTDIIGLMTKGERARLIGKRLLGKTLHMAWSGKTDRVEMGDNHRPSKIELGKIARGTIDVIKHGLVLPVVLWDSDDPILEIGELTKVRSENDAIKVQQWQRTTLAHKLGLPEDAVTLESCANS